MSEEIDAFPPQVLGYKPFVAEHYGPDGGAWAPWKMDNDRDYFGSRQAEVLFFLLRDHDLLPPDDQDLFMVDVSSHVPTHAVAMHRLASWVRKKVPTTLAGDLLAEVFSKDPLMPELDDLKRFFYMAWDALHLPMEDETAHVLFDRKGCLWTLADLDCSIQLRDAFHEFARVLVPGGCLVVDDILGEDRELQGEISTMQQLEPLYTPLLHSLLDTFEIFSLGEGKSRVRIFQKKMDV